MCTIICVWVRLSVQYCFTHDYFWQQILITKYVNHGSCALKSDDSTENDTVVRNLGHTNEIEPVHEISINVVCATSKASDQPAHTRSLIRAFASRLSILWLLSYWLNKIWSFLAEKEAAEARPSQHMSKCHVVGNHMPWLNYRIEEAVVGKGEWGKSLWIPPRSFHECPMVCPGSLKYMREVGESINNQQSSFNV